MTNKMIQKLIRQAQKETVPQVDVSRRVLCLLAGQQPALVDACKPMAWIATVATAAAACVAIVAFLSMKASGPDAANDIYQAISWVAR